MSVALKLIVVGLIVADFSAAWPLLSRYSLVHDVEETPFDRSSQRQRNDYTYYPGVGTYKFHTEGVTWNAARQTCEDEGAHLAVINSVAESKLLAQLLIDASVYLNYRYHAHIGVHELYNNGDWVTIHGDSLAVAGFDVWDENEPSRSHGNTEHCGSVGRSGKLNDNDCTKLRSFICELPYALSAAPSIRDGKPRSLIRRNDYRYTPNIGGHKIHLEQKNWNDARKICVEEGGYLAIINSQAELQTILQLLGETHLAATQYNLYIGFHDIYKNGKFVTIDGVPLEKVGFNDWFPGNPSNSYAGAREDCGTLAKEGLLNDIDCDLAMEFVCELPYVKPSDPLQHDQPETTATTRTTTEESYEWDLILND